jgi:hypothetical protein
MGLRIMSRLGVDYTGDNYAIRDVGAYAHKRANVGRPPKRRRKAMHMASRWRLQSPRGPGISGLK